MAILRNIAERKKAEREIIEAHDFLGDVFKTSVDGIITTDCKGTITMANRAVEEILSYSKGELIGKHTTELGPKGEKHKESVAELMAKIIEKGFVKMIVRGGKGKGSYNKYAVIDDWKDYGKPDFEDRKRHKSTGFGYCSK